jgi:hypothetical protein
MGHEGSLPRSQQPGNGPYPEPNESSPQRAIPPSKTNCRIILPTSLVLPCGHFHSGLHTKIMYAFLFHLMHATCVPPSSLI